MLPSDLNKWLSCPQTPWKITQKVSDRMQSGGSRFRVTLLQPYEPESLMVLRYFMANKPAGYSIGAIRCIHNRSLEMSFTAQLIQSEEEAKKFLPSWDKEELSSQRGEVIDHWKTITDPFSPITITLEQEELLNRVKVLPLWHGTNCQKALSICESGFTYFGKHAYFSGKGAGSTDIGYFGSGIYFTESAQYAAMYSQGSLLLSWISMREPFPVVSDKLHPQKCTDMRMLEGKGAYKNYDAHFIPVAPIIDHPQCMEYFPCFKDQQPSWHEIVVFQKAQALPCFIVELQADLIQPPTTTTYSFALCYAACQAGHLDPLIEWIKEDRQRLFDRDNEGENFLFAATLNGQLHILKWLYLQDPTLLQVCRKDGWNLMHVAIGEGHFPIITWLHEQDSQMIHAGTITPLHIAAFLEQIEIIKLFLKEILNNQSLIEEIIQRSCPTTLTFLLEEGLDPNQTNKFQQTLLHLAAYKGIVANIEILLEHGATLNAQDLSKKTPLYLATAQGHLAAVKCLLEHKADPTIVGIEADTLLHVAAFYGYTPLLQELLTHYPELIDAEDEDGKQPIHKAVWMDPKPDVVKLLLIYGANANATNKFGYTPLHWAAKHGHLESAQLLIHAGAALDIPNLNHDLPFDLAIRWGQDQLVYFFLGTEIESIDPDSNDIEKSYLDQLLQAKRENNPQAQIIYLEKLERIYIQKEHWTHGAKLINAALAILEKELNNPLFQQYLLARLERIEALFLESKGCKVPPNKKNALVNDRIWLRELRKVCFKQFEAYSPIEEILNSLTASYKEFLKTLILDTQKLLGTPPTEWACIAMGSMARNEMCPYSDLEFAFIIQKKTPETLHYFRTLTQLIELKIINLGETKFPIFARLFGESNPKASPTPGGFSLDTGGNTPLGKPGYYELIDTPKGLAQFQCEHWMEADIIVTNALSSVCHIAGDQTLFQSYEEIKESQLNETDGLFSFMGTPFHEKLALRLLEGNIWEFKPNLSKEKQETNAFGIKKELYRPLQSTLGSLKLFYNLKASSTFAIIQELLNKKILSPEGAQNLTQALAQVLSLRFEAHSFYQNEEEFLLHIEGGEDQDPHYLYLTEERLKPLHEIYKVLIPFHRCAEAFASKQSSKTFTVTLYDESPSIQGAAFEKTLQYAQAQEAYQQAVSLNPGDIDAQLKLGDIEWKMGKSREALPRCLKALATSQQKYGENHPDVAKSYNNIGLAYNDLGEYAKALEYYQKSLKISLSVLGENHPHVAISYDNIGGVYYSLGEYGKALEYHQKCLTIELSVLGENRPSVATSYNNIGGVYYSLGEYGKALEYHQKCLTIELSVLGENRPSVATSYNNIGGVYDSLGEYGKALEYHQKALKIRLYVLGENHPDAASSYTNIGNVYHNLGEYGKALEYYHKDLKISLSVLDKNHPYLATSYNNIGIVYDSLGEYGKALEYHQKSLKISLSVLGENHPDVALSYNGIGNVYYNLREYDKALEFFQKALKIWLQAYGKNHPNIVTGLKNLIASAEETSLSSIKNLEEVSILCTKILGKEHALVQELTQLLK